VMALTVTATGNHYFLDSLVGAVVALLAYALVTSHLPARVRALAEPRPGLGLPAGS
jgi:membrane-associated phospholipid phosphatase